MKKKWPWFLIITTFVISTIFMLFLFAAHQWEGYAHMIHHGAMFEFPGSNFESRLRLWMIITYILLGIFIVSLISVIPIYRFIKKEKSEKV